MLSALKTEQGEEYKEMAAERKIHTHTHKRKRNLLFGENITYLSPYSVVSRVCVYVAKRQHTVLEHFPHFPYRFACARVCVFVLTLTKENIVLHRARHTPTHTHTH